MICTTTPDLKGKKITEYLEVVAGEVLSGFSCLDHVVAAREGALQEMREAAENLGADAVVGINLQYRMMADHNDRGLIVSAYGTAVKVK